MIERGHEHYFQPVARHPLPDGGQEVLRQCVCGMEERRWFLPDEEHPYRLAYRFNGIWILPLDLLRLLPLGIEECDECHGEQPFGPCAKCGPLGVTEGGQRLGLPALAMRR